MDMGKPFRNMTEEHWPLAAILYDKFHLLRHLNDAMDQVRQAANKRVIQRPYYGLRDEDYRHLKILTCTLPQRSRT